MAPVQKPQNSFDKNMADTIHEPRELLIRTNTDLRKFIVKKVWTVNATKRVRNYFSQQPSLAKRRRLNGQPGNVGRQQESSNRSCSPEEIQTLFRESFKF